MVEGVMLEIGKWLFAAMLRVYVNNVWLSNMTFDLE